jgi:hypothetical protein
MKLVMALRRHIPNISANGSIRRGQIMESAVFLTFYLLYIKQHFVFKKSQSPSSWQ